MKKIHNKDLWWILPDVKHTDGFLTEEKGFLIHDLKLRMWKLQIIKTAPNIFTTLQKH